MTGHTLQLPVLMPPPRKATACSALWWVCGRGSWRRTWPPAAAVDCVATSWMHVQLPQTHPINNRSALILSPNHRCAYVKRYIFAIPSGVLRSLGTYKTCFFSSALRSSSSTHHSRFSIVTPFLLRYHKCLQNRLERVVELRVGQQEQSISSVASAFMVILAASAHVIRVLVDLNVSCCVLCEA
jgi:hypothetical protein